MESHTVRPGETLSAIARAHGISWQTLARMNAIADPNRLVVGQRLTVPPHDAARGPAHPSHTHPPAASAAPGQHPAPPAGAPPAASAAPAAGQAVTPAPQGAGGGVTEAQLRAIMPHAGTNAITYLAPLNAAMLAHGVGTPEQRAAFLAQVSVESMDLRHTEENLNYSAQRLHAVWPRRFGTAIAAQPYAHDPQALGNHVYANRLGNGDEASGDGYRFRGRGLIQVTGRDNYRRMGYEARPDDLATPAAAADSAARFWNTNGLNPRSRTELTRAQFDAVSRSVNGGDNGSNERWTAYQRALAALRPAP